MAGLFETAGTAAFGMADPILKEPDIIDRFERENAR
jgi:hypothetical protein